VAVTTATESTNGAGAFLIDLGEALHAASLPADDAERRQRDVARAFGVDAELFTLQSVLFTEVRAGGTGRVEMRRMPFDSHWNLTRAAALIALTDEIAAGRLDLPAARDRLAQIARRPAPYPQWAVVLGYGVYGGVVATRVGGGWRELFAGLVIGLVAGGVHHAATKNNQVSLEKSFLGAFLGSLAAIVLSFLLPPFDFGRALFGGMVMLVPAMVVTIGIHELANEALESGTIRLAYGLLRFAVMGAGITAAFTAVRFVGAWPAYVKSTPLPHALVLALVAIGGLALAPILQGRRRDLIWMVAAAVLAFGTQELTKVAVGAHDAPVVAAFVLGVPAYLQARIPGHVAFTMLVPGLLQLAPGFLGTEATIGLLQNGGAGGHPDTFFGVILVAAQLGLGLLIAGLVFRRRRPRG
jgi:uncharacterized membrane protein YjjP (DUF1212 family)